MEDQNTDSPKISVYIIKKTTPHSQDKISQISESQAPSPFLQRYVNDRLTVKRKYDIFLDLLYWMPQPQITACSKTKWNQSDILLKTI